MRKTEWQGKKKAGLGAEAETKKLPFLQPKSSAPSPHACPPKPGVRSPPARQKGEPFPGSQSSRGRARREKEVIKSIKFCTSRDFQPSCRNLNGRKSRCTHFLTEKLEARQMIDTQARTLRAFTQGLLREYGKVIYTIKRESKNAKNYFQLREVPSNTTSKKHTEKAKRESVTKSDFKL